MEYYYLGTINPDIILKTEKMVTDDITTFEGVIVRMSDKHQEELAHEVGEKSHGWVPAYFKLMSDKELIELGLIEETFYMNEYGGESILMLSQCDFFGGNDDKMYINGVVDYFTKGSENRNIGDIYNGGITSDFTKLTKTERDRIVSIDSRSSQPSRHETPKFTVIYSEMEDIMTQKYVVKTAHSTDYEYDELADFVSSLNENPFKINFIFEGHINPYSHE